jgi:hypothetical protein
MAPTLHETALLHLVDQADHDVAVDAERLAQLVLAPATLLDEQAEQAEVPRVDSQRGQQLDDLFLHVGVQSGEQACGVPDQRLPERTSARPKRSPKPSPGPEENGFRAVGVTRDEEAFALLDAGQFAAVLVAAAVEHTSRGPVRKHAAVHGTAVLEAERLAMQTVQEHVRDVIIPQLHGLKR